MVLNQTTSFSSSHIFLLTNSCLSDDPGHPDEEHHTPNIQHAANLEEDQWVPHLKQESRKVEDCCDMFYNIKLTKTPLTQPNLMVPPLASFAAKAAASSAADGSSPLARPSSNSSWQPVATMMEKKGPTGEQWRQLAKVKLKEINFNLEFYYFAF